MPYVAIDCGDFRIVSLQAMPDSVRSAKDLLPKSNPGQLEELHQLTPEYFGDSAGDLRMTLNVFAIQSNERTILVDTGLPPSNDRSILAASMKEAGINPEDIYAVIFSHGDLDHIGGAVDGDRLTYNNSIHFINRSQLQGISDSNQRTGNYDNFIKPVHDSGKLVLVEDRGVLEIDFPVSIHLVPTPGHRSGAVSVNVEQTLILGDTWHSAVQVTHPEWSASFDEDPEVAALTRSAVIKDAAEDGWLIAVPHTIKGGLGTVETVSAGYSWKSAD